MKVSTKYMYDSFIDDMLKGEREVYELRKMIASGKKLEKPSDSPKEYSEVVEIKSTLGSLENYNKNVEFAESWLRVTETAVTSVSELLIKAKSLAVSASTETMSRENRKMVANEVEQIINSIIDAGNTKYQGRFIFSGFKTKTPALSSGYVPSSAVADGSNTYKGSGSVTVVDQDSVPYRADIVLEVVDDTTYRYSLDGGKTFSSGTFSFEGTEAVAEFAGLQVRLPDDKLYQGDRFYISVLGGEYQGDQGAFYLKTGDLEVDRIKVNMTAEDFLKGDVDVMEVLRDLHAALKANNTQKIQEAIDKLDRALEVVSNASGEVGSRLNRIDKLKNFYSVKKEVFTKELSSREDTDMVEVTTKMAEADTFYKAVLTAFARMTDVNLLNYLA